MPDGLYERDALAWSEQQADLLRRLASGERVNDAVDWANLIDEVESVGRSELRACTSLLREALLHLLKVAQEPDSPAARHWCGEIAGFLMDARDAFTPSMRQHIDVERLYRRALYLQPFSQGSAGGVRSPAQCPFTLDDLIAEEPDVDGLLVRLASLSRG